MKAIITLPTLRRSTLLRSVQAVRKQFDSRYELLIFDDQTLRLGLPLMFTHMMKEAVKIGSSKDLWVHYADDDEFLPNRVWHDLTYIGNYDAIASQFHIRSQPLGESRVANLARSYCEFRDQLLGKRSFEYLNIDVLSIRLELIEWILATFGRTADELRFKFMSDWSFLLLFLTARPKIRFTPHVTMRKHFYLHSGSLKYSPAESRHMLVLLSQGYFEMLQAIADGKLPQQAFQEFPL